ncbi:MAG: glycoside hydrolase family 99-like domain-containing protein [Selenomonadaceae bacterium]|nr:glycoside hydrolase family 99-like domain-containing protein [Selenomonadaceae bacterium]
MNFVSEQEYIFSRLTDIFYKSNSAVAFLGIDNYFNAIWNIVTVTGRQSKLKYIVDFDGSPLIGQIFQNYRIENLKAVDLATIDTIVVLPKNNNYNIATSLRQAVKTFPKEIKVVGLFSDFTTEDYKEYVEYCEKSVLKSREDFVDFNTEKFVPNKNDTKIIAYYLPQFHQMEINNKFHGQGFTEWTNTSRAIPLFAGHYQPHIPYDVGYYDLKNPEAMKRQIELAKYYGIYGFCFYYYWFSGKKLMEDPLKMLYAHKEWDMPFCLMWANENWTSKWDGGRREIIQEQVLADDDNEKFMHDLLPYIKDKRYIKINDRPVVSIYRNDTIPKERFLKMVDKFRKIAKNNGFSDLFIMLVTKGKFIDSVDDWGVDSLIEFSFLIKNPLPKLIPKGYVNPYFIGNIWDMTNYFQEKQYLKKYHSSGELIRVAVTNFDNTARNVISGYSEMYAGMNPQTYKTWLKDIILESKVVHKYNKDLDMVFVNSWNEWAEGSHLEPDCRYGYAYLQATREALEETR